MKTKALISFMVTTQLICTFVFAYAKSRVFFNAAHIVYMLYRMATADAKPKVYKDGEYSDPVYKKLARINGEINKLTKNELQDKLTELGIDNR